MKFSFKTVFSNIYIKNLLAAIIIVIVLCFAVLKWLDSYTQHGESVEIPDVTKLTVEKAEPIFAAKNLLCQVIDSTFYDGWPSGAIIETVPAAGSKIKMGRTVFLRVNSLEIRLKSLPDVKDMSQRVARAKLRSLGFEKVGIRFVPGFRDLAVGLESRGREMQAGEKVSLDTPLELLVGSGEGDFGLTEIINDTVVNTEHGEGENWY